MRTAPQTNLGESMKNKIVSRTRISIAVTFALGTGLLGTAFAPGAFAQQPVQRVEITGSAIKQIQGETALPVSIITAEELNRQGISTVEQAMQTLSSNQSLTGVAQGIGATTGGQSTVELRGLGDARTLVLLNGRRIANHAYLGQSADLNSIPMAAIERIEVLRDGASSLYGSDAIGGVVNFILRTDYQGIEASMFQEILKQNGGDARGVSVVFGSGSLQNDGINIMGVYNWRQQEKIGALDRAYGATGIRPDLGFVGDSGTPFPANISQTGSTLVPQNPARVGGGNCPPLAFNNPNPAVLNCRYDFSGLIDLFPDNEQTQFYLRGSKKFGAHTASLEYILAENSVTTRVAPAPLTGLTMPPTSPFYPGNGITPAIGGLDPTRNISVALRNVPGGQRTTESQATSDRIVFNLDGVIGGWDYRAGLWRSKSEVSDIFRDGYVNRTQFQAGVTGGLINPFGAQTAAGQTAINGTKIIGHVIDAKGVVDAVDVKVSKDIANLAAGPLAMALGAEFRNEEFLFALTKDPANPAQSFASNAASSGLEGTVDAGGKRDMYAVFGEFNIPLIKKTLEAQLSGRYDHYKLTGNSFTPKVGLRYQPVESFLMRGSFNKGFRAPSLYEIFNPQQTTFTSNPYDDPVLCPGGTPAAGGVQNRDCGQQFNSLFGGPVGVGLSPESLKPEKSKTWTIGFVWEPVRDLSFGVDFWDYRIKDTIGQLPEQAVFLDPVKYASRFVRCGAVTPAILANPQIAATCFDENGVLQPQVLAYIFQPSENLGETKTRGLDLAAKWRLRTASMGAFTFSINGTYVSKYDYQREKDGVFVQNAGKFSDAGPIVRWQHNANVNWDYGPWTTTLTNRYKGSYEDQNDPARVDPAFLGHRVDSYSVWDMFVSYRGVKNLTLSAGVRNIANEDPPASNQGNTFQQGYDPRFHDIFGRVYVVRAAYKF